MATLNARLQEKLTQSLANIRHFQDNNCNSETIFSSLRFLEKAYGDVSYVSSMNRTGT
jgi:hypothetical protein